MAVRLFGMAAMLLLLPGVAVAAAPLDEIIRQVETRYARLTDLKATFTQNAFNKSLNESIPARGIVYLKKGGKMRWEYTAPAPQQIVSDGRSIWIYTPELNQVNVGEAPKVLTGPAGSFLAGLGKLRSHFTVQFLRTDDDGNYRLDLRPRKPEPALARLILVVDPQEYLVRSAEVFDQFDNTVTMKFTKVEANSGLPDALFAFVPPKDAATVPLDTR
jgi:outer membrane lipoprotein carrier protein